MQLATTDMLASREAVLDSELDTLGHRYSLDFMKHRIYGRDLTFYALLTEFPSLFIELGLSVEDVFWSRYYWFKRLASLYDAVHESHDALFDQAFQILEYPFPACSPNWDLCPEVESLVQRHLADQIEEIKNKRMQGKAKRKPK